MKKHMLNASIVALLGLAPLAAMAQDHTIPAESPRAINKLSTPSASPTAQGRSVSTGTTGPAINTMGTTTPRNNISTPKGSGDATEISR